MMTITKENLMESIPELEKLGFKRWQKGAMDRMYINASDLGLECSYYNTGNIRAATFDGEDISNSQAYKMKSAKTYIDLKHGMVVSDNATLAHAVATLIGLDVGGRVLDQYAIA